jgi:prevent-host-death family protein
MSDISPSEDIRSVTDLKRNTRQILDHLHATGRPVILTVNGRADSVLLDVRVYEMHLQAGNLAKLLAPAEREVESGQTRPARDFLKEFKRAKKIQG